MDYMHFIKAELLVLVPILYGLGLIFKAAGFVKDKYIPLVLTGISEILCCLYVLGSEGVSAVSIFTAIVQGILCAACAVYGNQIYKQIAKEQ